MVSVSRVVVLAGRVCIGKGGCGMLCKVRAAGAEAVKTDMA